MWLVQHYSVQLNGALVLVALERLEYGPRVLNLRLIRKKALIDGFNLGRVNRKLGTKAVSPGLRNFFPQDCLITKVGTYSVDWQYLRRSRGEQAHGPSHLICEGQRAPAVFVGGGSNR